jgi:hypothetical protein
MIGRLAMRTMSRETYNYKLYKQHACHGAGKAAYSLEYGFVHASAMSSDGG